jgi:hypothetical protein
LGFSQRLSIGRFVIRLNRGVTVPIDNSMAPKGARMMMRAMLVCVLSLSIPLSPAVRGDDKPALPATPTNPGFEQLKSLVGTWVAADSEGKPTEDVISVIRLTAGGSAIHETLFPGQPQEMISVYTAQGPDVVMTHYCMLGNQPRLKAEAKSAANEWNFEFAGGTNLDPKKDKHMHSARLLLVDADHIEVHGTAWENGVPAKEMCGEMKLVRRK